LNFRNNQKLFFTQIDRHFIGIKGKQQYASAYDCQKLFLFR